MIIDSDAHVLEPADLWTSRLSAKHGDMIPHIKYRQDLHQDWWFVGDVPIQHATGSVIPIREDGSVERLGGYKMVQRFADMHPSAYDPTERAKVMDLFGIGAATTYPSLGLTGPDIYRMIPDADLEYQLQVVRAYNDWILSWDQTEPGRFIPLSCVPYWDVPAAVREIERTAELGMKGIVMTGKPQNHGCPILPDPHWNDMWSAAEAAGQSVSFHVASGGMRETKGNPERSDMMGPEAIRVYMFGQECVENVSVACDLLTSGILQRHPKLNFAIVETGVGWVPFTLEALDEAYRLYQPWVSRPEMREDELPSDLFRRQVFVNIWYENARAHYPFDNVMFETDYPHPVCLMEAEIKDAVENRLSILSPAQLENVLWKNAMRCFNLSAEDVRLSTAS